MATGAPSRFNPAVPIRHRPNVADLSAADLAELRAAFRELQQRDDDFGYRYYAGLHGLPTPMWCDIYGHGKPTFLHWHRAYLWRFEQALRATGRNVMLPWWDWVQTPEIPAAYGDELDANGDPNPLRSAVVDELARAQALQSDPRPYVRWLAEQPATLREPGRPGSTLPVEGDIAFVLAQPDFDSFTGEMEKWHGVVHGWVGGHMSQIPFAAYDPIFWAHHAMIDRLWRKWQIDKPGVFDPNADSQVMQPFNKTAFETLDPTALGYDYAVNVVAIEVPA